MIHNDDLFGRNQMIVGILALLFPQSKRNETTSKSGFHKHVFFFLA